MPDVAKQNSIEDELRRSERRHALLLRILAEQRETTDPAAMMRGAAEAVGRHLHADRAGFFEIAPDEMFAFKQGWTAGRLPLLAAAFPSAWIGTLYLAEVRKGRTMGISDARIHPLTSDSHFAEIGTVALIGAPIVRNGRWQAGLYVNHAEPRDWTPDEIALVRDVANLTWDAVERAQAQEARRISEERLSLALEAAGAIGTWDWDVKADRVYCSEPFARMFSVDPALSATGAPVSLFIEALHPDDRRPTEELIRHALKTAGPFVADYRLFQPDGSVRWVHALGRAYRDAAGNPSRLPGAVVDITDLKEMERALRRGEEFKRRILESTRDCVKVLDLDSSLLSMNLHGQQELGIEDLQPLLNTSWLEFWKDPVDRAAAAAALNRARNGLEGHFEGFFATLSGEPRWWDVRITPIVDSNGRPERLLAVSRDITERKRAEDALKKARDRAATILESITDGFLVLDRKWRFTYLNPAGERFLISSAERLMGKSVWEVFPGTSGTDAERNCRQAVRERKPVEFEFFYQPWRRWFFLKAYPMQEGGLSVYFDDITAKKRSDEELRRQWHTFDTVLSHTPDFTYTFDTNGRFTYCNRALLSLLQLRLDQVIGRNFPELNYPPELAARLQQQIQEVIDTRRPLRDHTPFTGPAGETREYEYILVPVLGADGQAEAVAGSTRDVTDRNRAEERERERQAHMLDSARLESLGVMAGGIAHDFNNLLVGMLGNASLLLDNAVGEDRELVSEIVLSAERAAGLIRQMLAYSGKGHFVIETVDLNSLINENLALLRASLSRSVSVRLNLNHGACLVQADRTQVHQIVMNLLLNASEAFEGAPGQVVVRTYLVDRSESRLSAHLHTEVQAGRYAALEVSDNGVGMSSETIKRIFDPFFTTKFTGRGLGLAAVLGIVKGHRGDIEVESTPGVGTTFRVFLTVAREGAAARRAPDTRTANAPLPRGETVLVADDEDSVRRMAVVALQTRGFQVIQAGNGAEALDALSGNPGISAIILDLTMPVMTGEQVLPLIQAKYPGLPIVISSGFGEAEILRRFGEFGIAGVLQKPYTVSAIVSQVVSALETGREQRQAQKAASPHS